uniref:Uroporphyrinogen-III synthase n=1 Tax=Hyaloperonospora arabidopsidis (strain Emoy2) TaxID=559515 RepID=M4BT52_HYAAE
MSVLLLKAANEEYRRALEQSASSNESRQGLKAYFAQVLTFEYVNTPQLVDILTHLDRYSGILVTSPRSAIAVTNAVNGLSAEQKKLELKHLDSTPVFSVGNSTSRELLPIGVVCKGDDAGSADKLAEYLHQDGALPAACKERPMVFLCGNKRRDVLPDSFRSRGLPLQELVVYQTCAVSKVEFPVECQVPQWLVFFSPSGLEAVKHLPLPWESIRKAAIGKKQETWSWSKALTYRLYLLQCYEPGKTTTTALHEYAVATQQPFWEADVTAPKPTPESLANAIFTFECEHKS